VSFGRSAGCGTAKAPARRACARPERPRASVLSLDRDTLSDDPGDVALVTLEILDSAGTVVPDADPVVRFTVTGGTIVAVDNGNLQDLDPYHADRRHAFNGRGLVILRAAQAGEVRLTAEAEGLRPASLFVKAARGHAPAAIPPAR
jgi:beta-galactosidase